MRQMTRAAGLVILCVLLLRCGPQEAVDRGRDLFADPTFSQSPANVFACATCHAALPQLDGRRFAGHPLTGAASRPAFWGGGVSSLLDAVNLCRVEFMRGAALSTEDRDGLALLAFLRSLAATGDPAALPCTVVRDIDNAYLARVTTPKGDTGRGAALYQAACGFCHGDLHSGRGRLSDRVAVLPEDTIAAFGASKAPAVLAEKVRHGKFFGIGGIMPLYCVEMISDAELGDLIAYVLE